MVQLVIQPINQPAILPVIQPKMSTIQLVILPNQPVIQPVIQSTIRFAFQLAYYPVSTQPAKQLMILPVIYQ